jgi:hypothetical protein
MDSAAGIRSPLDGIAKTTDTRTGTVFHVSTACFAKLHLRSYIQLPVSDELGNRHAERRSHV